MRKHLLKRNNNIIRILYFNLSSYFHRNEMLI